MISESQSTLTPTSRSAAVEETSTSTPNHAQQSDDMMAICSSGHTAGDEPRRLCLRVRVYRARGGAAGDGPRAHVCTALIKCILHI
jgi:hypothetical protein